MLDTREAHVCDYGMANKQFSHLQAVVPSMSICVGGLASYQEGGVA